MRYLIALLLPFVAFWTMGEVFSGIICLILQLTLIGWLPAAIWAMIAVSNYDADKGADRIVRRRHAPAGTLLTSTNPGPTNATAQHYTTGIAITSVGSSEAEIKELVADWAVKHSNDASVAVALYDQLGNVKAQIYETGGDRRLVWSGDVGSVRPPALPAAAFNTLEYRGQIEAPIRDLVVQLLGQDRVGLV